MSTWIYRLTRAGRRVRRALFACLVLPLAGCLEPGADGGQGLGFLSPGAATEKNVLRKVALFGGDVVVVGPRGYCIDKRSLRRATTGGFALLASCESLSARAGEVVDPAVMTVSVLPRDASAELPKAADIAASMSPVKALDKIDGNGISLVHLAQGGEVALPGGDPSYWRASMIINGHLVGLAVYGPKGGVVAGKRGRQLITKLSEALRTNSPVRDLAPVAPVSNKDAPKPTKGRVIGLGGLFPKQS